MIDLLYDYRNPVFGILSLLVIVTVVFLFDSLKRRYTHKKKQSALSNLSKSFENAGLGYDVKDFILHAENATQTLILIAQTYARVGDHEQAIAIYKILNDHATAPNEKIKILELLGESYYKAGFLERSKTIFSEILRNYPHNIHILKYYMRACESLRQYDEALEALECIEELQNDRGKFQVEGNKNQSIKNYLHVMQICNDHRIPLAQQQEKLMRFYELDENLRGLILRHLRIYNVGLFWEKILETTDVLPYVDILWHFQEHEIPFSSISEHIGLLEIYRAKGFIKEYTPINHLVLESLQLLCHYSSFTGNVEFIYYCQACQHNTPFYSYRCPNCSDIGSIEVTLQLAVASGINVKSIDDLTINVNAFS